MTLADGPALREIFADAETSRYAGNPPRTAAQERALLRKEVSAWRKRGAFVRRSFAIALPDGTVVGGANVRWPHGGVAELGYSIHRLHRGKGYATEAARRLVEFAFRLGAHRVQATCWVKNPASARVLAKAGLRREGRLEGYLKRGREVRDEFLYGLARSRWAGRTSSLRPRTR